MGCVNNYAKIQLYSEPDEDGRHRVKTLTKFFDSRDLKSTAGAIHWIRKMLARHPDGHAATYRPLLGSKYPSVEDM